MASSATEARMHDAGNEFYGENQKEKKIRTFINNLCVVAVDKRDSTITAQDSC